MKNRKNTRNILVTIVLTFILTFTVTNIIAIKVDNKVVIPASEYVDLLNIKNKYAKVEAVEAIVKKNYLRDTNDEELETGQLKGLLESLNDPYSIYLTKEEYKSLNEQISGSFGGIGVVVTPGEDNLITVVSPIEGTPGERAGIKSGDKIIKVNGLDYTADIMDKATKEMKGEPGTEVEITILRTTNGKKENIDLKIVREIIKVETVSAKVLKDDIGYIKITSFDEPTYDDFKRELDSLGKKNIKGLIIDVRGNPGGRLDIVAKITDELIGEGDIVYMETKDGKREYLRSKKGMVEYPLVVLTNGGSASASEILAGAIKDHKRGKLVGTTTFGKGVVQRIIDLPDETGLKLTISEYFTPNGINIHGIGIEPDIKVELPENAREIGPDFMEDDRQLKKAIEILK